MSAHPILGATTRDGPIPGWRLQDNAFQWTGDLQAFSDWFGEFMPINAYEQISVPTDSKRNRWMRVSCGNWVVRHGDNYYQIENPLYRAILDSCHAEGRSDG